MLNVSYFYISIFRRICYYYYYFIIIIIISFMQGIYTHIPETNCVPREYSVAARGSVRSTRA